MTNSPNSIRRWTEHIVTEFGKYKFIIIDIDKLSSEIGEALMEEIKYKGAVNGEQE